MVSCAKHTLEEQGAERPEILVFHKPKVGTYTNIKEKFSLTIYEYVSCGRFNLFICTALC